MPPLLEDLVGVVYLPVIVVVDLRRTCDHSLGYVESERTIETGTTRVEDLMWKTAPPRMPGFP